MQKSYRFTIDDNIRFMEDIAKNHYKSIFDNSYLAALKNLHDKYGTKIQLNMYLSYTPDSFSLKDFPDTYKPEFEEASDWLHLAFHALHNDPAHPYLNTSPDVIAKDYDIVTNELLRIAGDAVNNELVTVHWVDASKESCILLKKRGVKGFMGLFMTGEQTPATSYFLNLTQSKKVMNNGIWKESETDLYFACNHLVINNYSRFEINDRVKHMIDRGNAYIDLMVHEQYFYSDYFEYHEDYMEKLQDVMATLYEKKYVSVFPEDILV